MIEVMTFNSRGDRVDQAECEPDAAILTARTLWRDAADVKQVGFYVDGKLKQLLDRCP